MAKNISVVPYILVMVAIIVAVDVLIVRHYVWARLLVNIGIVLVFGALYLRFLKSPEGSIRFAA
jgi:hypothetical protein